MLRRYLRGVASVLARLRVDGMILAGIPQMNPKPGWIFALLPRFDKTAWRRGRRP